MAIRQQTRDDYASLVQTLESLGRTALIDKARLTLDRYLWVTATLWSRCCDIMINGRVTRLLVPGFDLFNHDVAVEPGARIRTARLFLARAPRRNWGTASSCSPVQGGATSESTRGPRSAGWMGTR